MSSAEAAPPQVWPTAIGMRVGAVVVLFAWLALALGVTLGGGVALGVLVVVWLLGPVYGVGVWRLAFVPFVALTATAVVVQNRWGRQSVAYGDIASVHPGYYGTTMRLHSGAAVTAWAVQKPNWATWLHRRTRADELTEAILARRPPAPDDQ